MEKINNPFDKFGPLEIKLIQLDLFETELFQLNCFTYKSIGMFYLIEN